MCPAEIPPAIPRDPERLPRHYHRALIHLGVHFLNLVDTILHSFGYANNRAFTGRLLTSEERDRIKALERENKELRRANEILKLASAFFAQAELDRRLK